jgi:hypothetical protein
LEQEGDITNICVITRIFISRANQGTWSMEEVLLGGLKNPNPRQEIISVVNHIYFSALHELFSL